MTNAESRDHLIVYIATDDTEELVRFTEYSSIIKALVPCKEVIVGMTECIPDNAISFPILGATAYLMIEGGTLVPANEEKSNEQRNREIERLQGLIHRAKAKLSNGSFTTKAKPEVVELERKKLADWEVTLQGMF